MSLQRVISAWSSLLFLWGRALHKWHCGSKKRDPLLPLVPQGWQVTLTCHLYTKWIISGICKNLRRTGSRKNSPLSFDSSWIKLLLFVPCRVEGEKFSLAPKILANFLERKTQFYEQGATVRRIGQYVRNWWRWVRAGVEISYPYCMSSNECGQ